MWPEHQVVVSDPELARELLVAHHADLVRWEHAMHVFSGLQGRSVLVVEGESWHGKRTALQPAFSPRAVQSLVPTIVAACDRRWRNGRPGRRPGRP
ncbi:cytochrome P450 [Cupriavidus malaysiensis]|uniref:cytochrome P450 n=1 Tax=Cupriavidus malaysiensis TaxID=367825 RepID=UPI001F3801B8|nr:cytochrome P450 [Cupriavidus malaysiensis]